MKLLFAGLLMLASVTSREDIPPAIRGEIETLHGLTSEERLDLLAAYDDRHRADLLKWARIWIERRPSTAPDVSYYDVFLFHLGAEEILQRATAEFARGDYGLTQILINGRNPQVIPALAPIMVTDKLIDAKNPREDPPFAATETIVLVLQQAPQFSREVRAWARGPASMGDSYQQRAIVREWWKENERHFTARDYAAVLPGRTIVAKAVNSDSHAVVETAPAMRASPGAANETSVTKPVAKAGTTGSAWSFVAIVAGCLFFRRA